MYSPVAEIVPTVLLPPATPATLQFTAVVLVPVTVAVNCRILLVTTSAVGGETLTVIGALWEPPPPHDKSSNKQLNANKLRGREKVCQTFDVTASTPALLVHGKMRLIAPSCKTNLLFGFKNGAILHPSRLFATCETFFICRAPNTSGLPVIRLKQKTSPTRGPTLDSERSGEQKDLDTHSTAVWVDSQHTSRAQSRFPAAAASRTRMKTYLFLVIIVFVVSLAAQDATQPASSQKRSITEKDLFDFVWIADPQVSPDGTRAAFTRVTVDDKRTNYETSIWIAATNRKEAPIRMTNGKHDTQPRWSPDGTHIVFVRGGDKDETGKPKPGQLAMLSLAGGEASTITDLPEGASNPVWSPDGKRIAFVNSTTQEDIEKAQRKKNAAKPGDTQAESEHESDVHVISRAVYRSNNRRYLHPKRHAHIWLLKVPAAPDELLKPQQLTTGNFDEGEPVWSHDGSRIHFFTRRIDEPYYELPSTDIYSVPSAAETRKTRHDSDGYG